MATTKSPYKIASKTLSSGINKVSGAMAAAKKKADEAAAAKKKAAEEAARKKAAAEAAARKKRAADNARKKKAAEDARKKAASETIQMKTVPASEAVKSISTPKPSNIITPQTTVSTLSKVGEMQKTLDKAAMSGMDEGKVSMKRGGAMKKKKMRTGGMVNSNSKVSASTVARGTVGGKSKAPKNAVPKAMYGRMMKKGGAKR